MSTFNKTSRFIVMFLVIVISLSGNVNPAIGSSVAHAQAEGPGTPVPGDWQTYVDPQYGFQLGYPAEGWVGAVVLQKEAPARDAMVKRFTIANEQLASINIDVWRNSAGLSIPDWVDQHRESLLDVTAAIPKTSNITIGGTEGFFIVQPPNPEQQLPVPGRMAAVLSNNEFIYWIEYIARDGGAAQDIYISILETFEFKSGRTRPDNLLKVPLFDAPGQEQSDYEEVTAAAAFSKTAPANGATGVSTTVTLKWEAASPAPIKYRYAIESSASTDNWTSVYSGTQVAVTLSKSKKYYWQVQAVYCDTCVPKDIVSANGGTWWSFTTGTAGTATITGHTGVGGVTLSYTDGVAKTVTSGADGNYSITVPFGWSGTVTPAKAGYTFSPVNRPYANVQTDLTGQNYAALVTISGNAGTGGATLSYTDGVAKTVTSAADGSYAITVPYGWSGTVVPSKTGFTFSPTSRSYFNLQTSLTGQNYTLVVVISGNVEIGGALLTYTDVTPKAVAALSNGNYSFTVPYNWSGRVTPSHFCYAFDPLSRNYPNLTNNQSGQNYTATFVPSSGCADVHISIAGTPTGRYGLPAGDSVRTSSAGVNNGPVKVQSANGVPILASERVNLLNHPAVASYTEFMGMPATQLTDTYLFPWYNNLSLDSQLRFANVGTDPTTVTVKIGTLVNQSYLLAANASMRISYPGVDTGPVEVKSSGGVPIIASERINLLNHPLVESYTEFIGLLGSNTAGTRYLFPWYNNVGLDSQLRFANVGTAPTTVTVKIGTLAPQTYSLAINESKRISYPGVDAGPVEVTSSGGVPIIASERINLLNHPAVSSYTEFLGLPGTTLTHTKYLFPWYNNVGLDSQLRIANVGSGPTTVTVKIGTVVNQSYPLAINESKQLSFPSVDSGPVIIESSGGVPIIASQRVNLLNHPSVASYSEFMGLSMGGPSGWPGNQLSDTFWFPWYNNVGLDSQLRFAAP